MKLNNILLIALLVAGFNPFPAFAEEPDQSHPRPEVQLYLEGLKLENSQQAEGAARKFQEALLLNPTFVLAQRRLFSLGDRILTDHRKSLKLEPGYSIKPSPHDARAVRGPVWIKDVMPGYLMIYEDPKIGEYGVFSLRSRHMHNLHYLFVKEDESWMEYPSVTLPGVTRMDDILVYHQPGETIQEGFIQTLIHAFVSNTNKDP